MVAEWMKKAGDALIKSFNIFIFRLTKVYTSNNSLFMNKRLKIENISRAMDERGLNQAGLAKKLGVSRTIVSSWFKGQKFPRPDKLLKLGLALGLQFQDIVQRSVTTTDPIVAFRKKGSRKTKDLHISHAKEMGQLLELLVPYLPFDGMFQPPVLINPKVEFNYIQAAAAKLRSEIGFENSDPIEFERLIHKLNEFEVILIPVFYGQKEHHENALHIYLPTSKTTWIYLNLDSNIHDFKFWMAHELGHVIVPALTGETAEDFADGFAQALLFPQEQAAEAYNSLKRLRSTRTRVSTIIRLAESLTISPITIYKAINDYAAESGLDAFNLEPDVYAASTNLNKKYANVSNIINNGKPFSARQYVNMTRKLFRSPFFKSLKIYISENDKSAGFIQSVLDISILDAKEIHAELVQ
jgi:transcriptional regulator with XRE-family HTH domain